MRGSMKTLFLSEGKCLCTSIATVIATFNWRKITLIVREEEDLEPAIDLIRMSPLFCPQTESFTNATPIEPTRHSITRNDYEAICDRSDRPNRARGRSASPGQRS